MSPTADVVLMLPEASALMPCTTQPVAGATSLPVASSWKLPARV